MEKLRMTTERKVIGIRIFPLWCVAVHVILMSVAAAANASSQTPPLSVPADSEQWLLEAQAKVVDYQGRRSIMLDGGAATPKDFEIRDGVIDVDAATPAARGYFGF